MSCVTVSRRSAWAWMAGVLGMVGLFGSFWLPELVLLGAIVGTAAAGAGASALANRRRMAGRAIDVPQLEAANPVPAGKKTRKRRKRRRPTILSRGRKKSGVMHLAGFE